MFKRSLILFLFFLVCYTLSLAQSRNLQFTSISVRNGLSSNTINDILKDKYGYVWFATEDGLNRFDGKDFVIYRYDHADSTSLRSNEINCLYEDPNGTLWIGTNGGSLAKYIREKDCFYTYKPFLGKYSLNSSIKFITSDYLGKIWIANYGGINVLDPKTGELYRFSADTEKGSTIPAKTVLCLFEDSKKRMWIGTDNGLLLYDRKSKSFKRFIHSSSSAASLSSDNVRTITEDKKGDIWIGTNKGICKLISADRNTFKSYDSIIPENTMVYVIKFDKDDLWIGTEDGLYILNTKTEEFSHFKSDLRKKYSLSRNSIRSIFIDKNGIYWIGTFQGGVNKFDKNLTLFNVKQSIPFDRYSLNESLVTSFAEKDGSMLFIGTDKGGLNIFNRQTELFYPIELRSKLKGNQNLSILCLLKSEAGKLWIGTYMDGLFLKDIKSGATRQFLKGNDKEGTSINNNNIFCLEEDRNGNIWIGTNGDGINIYNPKNQTFKILNKDSKPNSLPLNGYIRSIVEDHNGNIWIGSHGTGLALYDNLSQTFKVYDRSTSNIPDNSITTLYVDKQNSLWIGTMGGGVSLFNPSNNSFTNYSEKDGLLNSEVCKILGDENGNIWLSSNKGISSINPITKKIKNYSVYNGVINNNFVRNAGIQTQDGTLFFGNLEGFNFFDISNLKANKNIPPVLLADLKVDNKTIRTYEEGILEADISVAKQVVLNYNQNFSLSYIALNYTAPQQNQYAYKLEGYDANWNFVGTSKVASYTNIAPGEYVFKVKASNNDGLWNKEGTSIKIIVKPPFWLTIYAYILYFLAFVGIIYYMRRRGIQKIESKYRREQEIEKAKQFFEEEKREVERQSDLQKMKLKFLTNLSHEFRTPISLIMAPVDKILSLESEPHINEQASVIKRNARRLLNLVNQLLDFRKMEENELNLNLSKGEIVSFIKDSVNSFQEISEKKRIQLEYSSEVDEFITYFDSDKLERILFNLLSNAFKFTNEGDSVSVHFKKSELITEGERRWFIIKIADTGVGMPKEIHESIFSRFFQNEMNTSILNQGSGIGLSITKEFVKLHGGEISVESEVRKGSVFSIHIPLKPYTEKEMDENELLELELSSNEAFDIEDTVESKSQFAKPKIVVVEDNEEYRVYLKENLMHNYKIIEASNGKEGWQQALYNHPELIISDINMPYMNGIELTNKIKSDKRTSHIPVILLTAATGEEEQLAGLETGANDYMTKPVNFEILNIKVKNILDLNQKFRDTYSKQIKVLSPEVEIKSNNEKLINKVFLYIEENLTDPKLSVEDLSKSMGMSRGVLYHKILEITGSTPVEFIRSIKLEKALVLLEKSDMNVAQIAYCVGFASPNYFTKSFKAKYNVLPSEYINSNRKG